MNLEKIEKELTYQPMLNPNVRKILDNLIAGRLTSQQLHNRKSYAKKKRQVLKVVEYGIALDIYKMIEKNNV